ncbi:MAG: RNA polymerase factor sigma-54 [Thermoguttaceae bacterium]|jgi:RNA polymerase sigma-54 factor|nr:RNA polymerase factor sigma-54 [Thermoguttaceae bacterium]
MRLSFGQEMRLQQKQVLAPRMIQSMEILQLPILALQERIEQELQENPVLELREADPDLPAEPEAEERDAPDAPTDDERELVIGEKDGNEDDFERLMKMDEEWPDHFEERSRPSRNQMEDDSERQHDAMANMTARPQSLQDYLHDQLGWFELSAELRAMADRVIYNLDDNGYLQGRIEDLLGLEASAEDRALAEEALRLVQGLDPPGVGARDARECLLLQLVPGMPYYEELLAIVTDHWDDLTHNRLPVIARRTGFTLEAIQAAIGELKKLNLSPGADFASEPVPPVTPDVFVEQNDDGQYMVRLEDGRTPSLYISPYYRKLFQSGEANNETREYIKRKINSAQWLIESIEQRRNTLSRVSQAIVDHQRQFLDKGPEAIEPLKMQQIADKVGVHVTTVSRAVDDKWIQTPRGIFPLKRFFCGGTISADGEEVTWDAIRLKLQEVIDHEDKQNPMSDEELVNALAEHGLHVARRTVTKYRKAMNIPSSRQRREWVS